MLIGLAGKRGHGKTTVAQWLVERHGFRRMRFAAPLKEAIGWNLLFLTEEQTDGYLKDAPCVDLSLRDVCSLAEGTVRQLFPRGGNRYGLSRHALFAEWVAIYESLLARPGRLFTPREIMLHVGNAARERISPLVWRDLWCDAYRAASAERVVVDDVRFPWEKDAIEGEGGEVWRVVREDHAPGADEDASERGCDAIPDGAFAAVLRCGTGQKPLIAELARVLADRFPLLAAGNC